ncbi:MAG: hypothetical protein FJ221_02620 [Lentisphaerae bacterium]|nr:hypothetical protein [Lentisphaerota bacterium]
MNAKMKCRSLVAAALGMAAVAGNAAPSPGKAAAALAPADAAARARTARALGGARDARAVPALTAALKDPDVNVRFHAAWALGEIRDPAAATALLGALADPEWVVRDQAAWALRELRDPALAGALVKALAVPGADVPHIAWILRETARDAAPSLLAPLSAAPEAAVRLQAVQALGMLNGSQAVETVRGVLAREKDTAVRAAAEAILPPPPPPVAPAAHWSFDDGGTTTARDATGRGNDGQIRGCEVVEGRVGKALRFGKGRYVELGKPSAFSMGGQPVTVMAWIRAEGSNGVVVARGGAACGFSLHLKDGAPRFGIRRAQEEAPVLATGSAPVGDGWTHLAGVVRDDRLELFVNGAKVAETKSPGFIPGNGGQGMEIGFDVSNSPCEITDPFEGLIDEVKVFHAALPAAEIAAQAGGRMP